MNKLGLVLLGLFTVMSLANCASKPKPQGFVLPPALSEVFRNGELKGLESNTTGELGMPNENDLVSHTCTSKPLFNIYGQYVRTVVSCW